MSEIQEKFNQAVQDLNVEEVKVLINDITLDVLSEASKSVVTMELMSNVVNRSEAEEDVVRREPIKQILEIFKTNSNVILNDKIKDFKVEELEDFLSSDDLSHLSFTLFDDRLKDNDLEKSLILLNSKHNQLEESVLSKVQNTYDFLMALSKSNIEELKTLIEKDLLTESIQQVLLQDLEMTNEIRELLVKNELFSVEELMLSAVSANINDFEEQYQKYQSMIDNDLNNKILIKAIKSGREIVFDFVIKQESLTEITEDVAFAVMNGEREKLLKVVVLDSRFVCDYKKFANYARQQKEFNLFMKIPSVKKYVTDNHYSFTKGDFYKKYKAKNEVRNKFADF